MLPRQATNLKWNRLQHKCNRPQHKCSRHLSTCSRLCKRLAQAITKQRSLLRKCKRRLPLLNRPLQTQTPMDSKVENNSLDSKADSKADNRVRLKVLPMFHNRHGLLQTMQSRVQHNVHKLAEARKRLRMHRSKLTKVQEILNRVQAVTKLV